MMMIIMTIMNDDDRDDDDDGGGGFSDQAIYVGPQGAFSTACDNGDGDPGDNGDDHIHHQGELKKAKMLEILLASVFSMVYDV